MRLTHFAIPTLLVAAGALAVAAVRPAVTGQEPIQPTEHHEGLLTKVGEWEGTLTTAMPGMPENSTAARETVEPVGALWIQSRFECNLGMPYVGTGCTGYDPAKKKFVGTWIDNFDTYLALMKGDLDPETGAIVMHWEGPNPVTGELVHHRSVNVGRKDSYTSTFFMGEGEGVKYMVIEMKRVAGPVEAGSDK